MTVMYNVFNKRVYYEFTTLRMAQVWNGSKECGISEIADNKIHFGSTHIKF